MSVHQPICFHKQIWFHASRMKFWFIYICIVLLLGVALSQASWKDYTIGGWENAERGRSSETHGGECEVEFSARQERGSTSGIEWTMQGNGLERFEHVDAVVTCILLSWYAPAACHLRHPRGASPDNALINEIEVLSSRRGGKEGLLTHHSCLCFTLVLSILPFVQINRQRQYVLFEVRTWLALL